MTVTDIRKQTAAKMGDGDGEVRSLACSSCGMSTAYDTLSAFGKMCFPCYKAYCRADLGFPAPVHLEPFEASSPKAWAYKLRARDKRGDSMTDTQRDMWREALNSALRRDVHELQEDRL